MKMILGFGFLLLLVAQANAQNQIGYRKDSKQDDPFVFCTEGWKRNGNWSNTAWNPVSPFTGGMAWIPHFLPWCPVPHPNNTKCPVSFGWIQPRPWTKDDWQGYLKYEAVCPDGVTPGDWDGNGGKAKDSPTRH